MRPYGYEPALMQMQFAKGAGIFACDEFVVLSNDTTFTGTEDALPVPVYVINGSVNVPYGGKWNTALNADVFTRAWQVVGMLGRWQYHDWTVKLDPDAVFFPDRLRKLLLARPSAGMQTGRTLAQAETGRCGYC